MTFVSGAILAILASGPIMVTGSPERSFEIGYEKLIAGQDQAAVEEIEGGDVVTRDDPARLINLGIALARTGQLERARGSFEAVARHRQRLELETSTGEWVDSRSLARRALAMLDRGELAERYALLLR